MSNVVLEKSFISTEDKTFVRELLHNEEIRDLCVTFTKKDGTQREMFCTLSESRIPTDKKPKNTDSVFTDEALRVFDEKIGEWRSFRWESVIKIEYTT